MKKIIIKKVKTTEEMDNFIQFPKLLYADSPYFIPNFSMEEEIFFKTKKNTAPEFSDLQAFIAFNQEGKVLGRIAGIINHQANKEKNKKNVIFSFFDFVDDIQVSAALLNAVINWGKEQGMEYIQGPKGITDSDKGGMLIEDFEQLGSINTLYNYPYYPQHMKELGYEKEVDWIQIHIDIPSKTPYKYAKVAHICKETFNLKAIKINNADIAHRGYSSKIFHFLKQTYFPLFGFTKFSDKQIDDLVKKYLGLIDMRLVSVVENEKNEVIGIAISMYSLSHAIQRSKGKLYPFGWYHLIKALKWRPENHVDLLFIAVRPDYQMLGVNAILFDDLISSYNQLGILWAETAPLQENSIQELDQWKLLNPTFTKRRRCYIKKI